MRQFGLVLLGLLLFVCFVPLFSVIVIFPITFIFGAHDWLYTIEVGLVYLLSAAAAVWIISRLWNPKPRVAAKPADQNSN